MSFVAVVDNNALSLALLAFSAGFVIAAALGVVRVKAPGPSAASAVSHAIGAAAVAASGVLSGAAPTGRRPLDVAYVVLFGGCVGFLAVGLAKRPLLLAALPTLAFLTLGRSTTLSAAAWCFLPLGAIVALNVLPDPPGSVRVAAATALGAALFWYPTNVRSLAPSLVAAAVTAIVVTAATVQAVVRRRNRPRRSSKRRRVVLTSAGVVVLAGLGVVGLISVKELLDTKTELETSVGVLRGTFGSIEKLDISSARQSLADASLEMGRARDRIDTPVWKLAKFVPVGAQNAEAVSSVIADASSAIASAEKLIDSDPLTRLRLADGGLDLQALDDIGASLSTLESRLSSLQQSMASTRNPWTLGPLRRKIDAFQPDVDRAASQLTAAKRASDFLPEILGGAGTRTYLLVFPTPAEARGSGGLIGNWGELTIENGRISLTRFDRILSLIEGGKPWETRTPTFPPGYLDTYAAFTPKRYFQNLLASPDFPTNAMVMAGQYPEATEDGREVDGVLSVDPYGLAAILALEGPLTIEGIPQPVTSESAPKTLMFDLYVAEDDAKAQRIRLLEEVARQTFERLRDIPLDDPNKLVATLGPAFTGRHIQMWSKNSKSQAYLESIGAAGAYRRTTAERQPGFIDSFGVVSQNAGGNKIDWFLSRDVRYDFTVDADGTLSATAVVDIQNRAPSDGLPDYIIGNVVTDREVKRGTASELVWVYSTLDLTSATVNGKAVELKRSNDLGLNVYSAVFDVASMSHQTLTLNLKGEIAAEEADRSHRIELLYQPQVTPDAVTVTELPGAASTTERQIELRLSAPKTVTFSR